MQPQSTASAHVSPAQTDSAAHVAPSASTSAAVDGTNRDDTGHALSPPSPAVSSTSSVDSFATALQSPSTAVATVPEGSRVRIEGLQAAPEMNGRTGIICSAFNQESGRWTVQIDADGTNPPCQLSIRPVNLKVIHTVSVDATRSPLSFPAASSTPQPATASPAPLQEGSRVRIEGLQAAPEMNGRTGVVCGALDQENGRWTVQIDADGARDACRGAFRAANLRVIPSHNFGTEWVDEEGRVWLKNVDFSRECAKGHALAPVGDCGGDGGGMRLMCRLCHCFCERDSDEAASWLTCSVVAGCCGGYVVCCSCARAPNAVAAVEPAGSDDFHTLVSCGVERFVIIDD